MSCPPENRHFYSPSLRPLYWQKGIWRRTIPCWRRFRGPTGTPCRCRRHRGLLPSRHRGFHHRAWTGGPVRPFVGRSRQASFQITCLETMRLLKASSVSDFQGKHLQSHPTWRKRCHRHTCRTCRRTDSSRPSAPLLFRTTWNSENPWGSLGVNSQVPC